MSDVKTINVSVEIMKDLGKIGTWMDARERKIRRVVEIYQFHYDPSVDGEEALNVMSLTDVEFLEILDGMRRTADHLLHLASVAESGGAQ